MRLYLLRHAYPLTAAKNQTDFERELSPSGMDQLPKLSRDLKQKTDSFMSLEVYCSSAKRTQQTVQGVVGNATPINYLHELYLPKLEELLTFLNRLNSSKDILIVGHNPGLSQLASYYSGQQILLAPGDLAVLDFEIDNSNGFSRSTAVVLA